MNKYHAFYELHDEYSTSELLVCGRPSRSWTYPYLYAKLSRKSEGLINCKDCLRLLKKRENYTPKKKR